MWPVRAYGGLKIKISAALYRKYWNYLSIPQFFVSIWHCFYMQKLTLMCIWYAMVMIRDVGFFRWWRRRGRIKLIKRTSSSARAPPTEKHNILHSFNQFKKSIAAFRHDFLLILIVCLRRFLCSYFNDKCPQRIIAYAKGKYLCSQVVSFPLTENVLSISQILHVYAQKWSSLLSLINTTWSVGIHWQKHTFLHICQRIA